MNTPVKIHAFLPLLYMYLYIMSDPAVTCVWRYTCCQHVGPHKGTPTHPSQSEALCVLQASAGCCSAIDFGKRIPGAGWVRSAASGLFFTMLCWCWPRSNPRACFRKTACCQHHQELHHVLFPPWAAGRAFAMFASVFRSESVGQEKGEGERRTRRESHKISLC